MIAQISSYLNSNFIWDPKAFSLSDYREKSMFESNVIEFWAPVTDLIIPGIMPGRYWVSSWGNTWNIAYQEPFGLSEHRKGYYQYAFTCYDQTGNYYRITRKLHIVIMKTFCYFPGCDSYDINHKDTNKKNNKLDNLEWCTSSENTIHAINNGVKTVFGRTVGTVISDEMVGEIYSLFCSGMTVKEIHNIDKFKDININTLSGICHKHARIAWFKAHGLL